MSHRALALTVLLSLSVPLFSSPPRGQTPTFRAEVSYVEVTARVLDAAGAFVSDLRQEDLELLEEGRPQKISDFRLVDLATSEPGAEASVPPAWEGAEPDVMSNSDPAEGRIYVLVLDNLHVRPENTVPLRRMARLFLEKYFADGDIAAVVNTRGSAEPAQDFTTSRTRLLSTIDKFGVQTYRPEELAGVGDVVAGGLTALAEDTLNSLATLANLLGTVKGKRKAVVFFSEGPGFCEGAGPATMRSDPSTGGQSGRAGGVNEIRSLYGPSRSDAGWARPAIDRGIRALVTAANRGNVAVYSVDPRQLVEGQPGGGNLDKCDDLEMSRESLRDISVLTGGFVMANTNNLAGGFERIRQDNSRYYVLGYYPSERAPEGTFRRITVKARRPGLRVEARQGYHVPARPAPPAAAKEGEVSPALRDALDSVLPVPGLRLSAGAAAFRNDKNGADVLVSLLVDGRDITFQSAGGRLTGSLELALGTMNSRGEHGPSEYELVQLPLDESARATVLNLGVRIVRKLSLAPGRYQLRAGIVDRPTARAGVVHLDVIVPDYRKIAFDFGGVLVTSSLAGRTPTARGGPLDLLQRQLPGPPALTREFRVGEDLAIYSELYGPGAVAPQVTAVVLDEAGAVVARQEAVAPTDTVSTVAPSTRVEVRRKVSLQGLGPGRYLLRLEARAGKTGGDVARRDVPFSVVP